MADITVVMAKTDPMHQGTSNTVRSLSAPNPGYQILRNIETMQPPPAGLNSGVAIRLISRTCACRENLLGGRAKASTWANTDLHGRLRHGMHNVAMAQLALDLAAEHVSQRQTFGKRLADRQGSGGCSLTAPRKFTGSPRPTSYRLQS